MSPSLFSDTIYANETEYESDPDATQLPYEFDYRRFAEFNWTLVIVTMLLTCY